MSRSPWHVDDRGLAGIVLVLVITWALAAVFMLARTLVAAQQIDRRVGLATQEVAAIEGDTEAIRLLRPTEDLTARIADETAPLPEQLDQVVAAVDGIEGDTGSILEGARSIGGNVERIRGHVDEIDADASRVKTIFTQALGVTESIDDRVAGINRRAARVIDTTEAIETDLSRVLHQVGLRHDLTSPGGAEDITLHDHANSIDCSPLLVASSTHCRE